MLIVLQSAGAPLTPSLEDYIRRRINFSLARFSNEVRKIKVRVSDTAGAGGSYVKRCLIKVSLKNNADVTIEDVQDKAVLAVDRAAHRAKKTLLRRLTQRRRKNRFQGSRFSHSAA
ncbi:hypothetical protein GCM10011369_26910 [Neiella marina]|uniref:HPF/RaiA family ribosome-associated protein n=1 Tax=Neiella marina TaxID=508461 RepID=A0A8J2U730_9GAMM|nr:HPF/RaiA family ribosome-associated protein [Neiella marina]GGA83519.1 hypothetical protein GCM10011369_26910 [Neiella marina]